MAFSISHLSFLRHGEGNSYHIVLVMTNEEQDNSLLFQREKFAPGRIESTHIDLIFSPTLVILLRCASTPFRVVMFYAL